ncbi:separin-like [Strix uralensis]|uniref:separin-like n=1 Tax=Strix uralensis TaxID=36305 RepID=UPI003DA6F553
MQSWEGTEELLAELGERLSCSLEDASDSSQASRLRKSQVCDQVLRICIEQMAQPGGCPPQVTSLVAVAEAACQGYLRAVPQPAPFCLEKIRYHLLRTTAGQGSGDACWSSRYQIQKELACKKHFTQQPVRTGTDATKRTSTRHRGAGEPKLSVSTRGCAG